METRRGIVMERGEREAILLTPAGEFLRVSAVQPDWVVGQEVTFTWPEPVQLQAPRRLARWARRPIWGVAFVAAAVALLVLARGALPTLRATTPPRVADPPVNAEKLVVAYVTVDINPSVELGVGADGRVWTVRPLNDDGDALVDRLVLEGLTAEEAVARLTEAAVASGYLAPGKQNAVVIAATPVPVGPAGPAGATAPPARAVSAEARKQLVARLEQTLPPEARKVTERRRIPGQVVGLAAPGPVRDVAEREGVSVGRLLLVLDAKRQGIKIEVEDVRGTALAEAVRRAGGNPQQVLGGLRKFAQDPQLDNDVEKYEAERKRRPPPPAVKPRPVRNPDERRGGDGKRPDDDERKRDEQRKRDDADDERKRDGRPGGDVQVPIPGRPGIRVPALPTPGQPGTQPGQPGNGRPPKPVGAEDEEKREEERKREEEARKRKQEQERKRQEEEQRKREDARKRTQKEEERKREGDPARGEAEEGNSGEGGAVTGPTGQGSTAEWEAFLQWLKRLHAGQNGGSGSQQGGR